MTYDNGLTNDVLHFVSRFDLESVFNGFQCFECMLKCTFSLKVFFGGLVVAEVVLMFRKFVFQSVRFACSVCLTCFTNTTMFSFAPGFAKRIERSLDLFVHLALGVVVVFAGFCSYIVYKECGPFPNNVFPSKTK